MAGASVPSGARANCIVTPQWSGTAVILHCSGDLDMVTAATLERHIDEALNKLPSVMIIDLSAVDFLASHGMGILIGTYALIAGRVDFAVVAHGPTTSRPMTLLGLEKEFPIYATLRDALATGDQRQ